MKNGFGLVLLRTRIGRAWWLSALFLLATTAAITAADFTYTVNSDNTITITGYTGPGGAIDIPSAIDGKTVTSIGNMAFNGCASLTSVTIGYSVASIGSMAFYTCTNMTSVIIGNNVTNIGDSAFGFCYRLTSVMIGNSVASIGVWAFYSCTSLAAITVDTLNPVYSSVDGVLLNKSQAALIYCPGGKAGNYTIPDSVVSIGASAFSYCANLASVTIPNSVTGIGDEAFSYCTSLTRFYFKGNAPSLGGEKVFYGNYNATVYYLAGTTGWGPTFGGLPTVLWNPMITANGLGGDANLGSGDTVAIAVQIDPGESAGVPVDWWVVAFAGSSWYYLNSSMQWTEFDGNLSNCHPVYQGGLFNLPSTEVLNIPGLPVGSYTFFFAVDLPMNGILNMEQIWVDSVTVNVR